MRSLFSALVAVVLLAAGWVHADEAAYRRSMADAADLVKREDHGAAALKLEAAVKHAQVFGANDLRLAEALQRLGRARRMLHEYAPAEASYQRALGILERAGGDTLPRIAVVLDGLGEVSHLWGKLDDAANYYEHEITVLEKISGPTHPSVAHALSNNLAAVYRSQSRFDEVEATYKRSLAILEKSVPPGDARLGLALIDLADWYKRMERYRQAESYYRRGAPIVQAAFPPAHERVLAVMQDWGLVNQLQGRFGEAESIYTNILRTIQTVFSGRHPLVVTVLHNLVTLYEAQGRVAEAAELRQQTPDISNTRTRGLPKLQGQVRRPN